MADWYVYSGAGGAQTGADWANAKLTLQAAISAGAAGDRYFLAHDHLETSTGANVAITFKGTVTAIDRVIAVNRAGSVPPVSADIRTRSAIIELTGAFSFSFAANGGNYVYLEGVIFKIGSGATTAAFAFNGGWHYMKGCAIQKLGTTGTVSAIFGTALTNAINRIIWDDVTLKFGSTLDAFNMRSGYSLLWKNTANAIDPAGAIPTTLINNGSTTANDVTLDGVDLSALGAGKTIFGGGAIQNFRRMINCKLDPAVTISGALTSNAPRHELYVSDGSATGYRQEIYSYGGTLTTETTIVRTGGASDGVQAISHKMVSGANAKKFTELEGFPYAIWNDVIGVPRTLTVEIINDGVTLKNDEVWLEAEYLGSATDPLASYVSNGVADVLAAGANLPTSSETWTTTGLTTPVKQYLQVTFTPQMKGFVRFLVKVARASKTVYVCPKPALA